MASPVAAQARKLLRDLALRPPLLAPRSQPFQLTSRRWLNLQEYQSKKLMSDNGVKVQRFFVADTANEAQEAAKKLSVSQIQAPFIISLFNMRLSKMTWASGHCVLFSHLKGKKSMEDRMWRFCRDHISSHHILLGKIHQMITVNCRRDRQYDLNAHFGRRGKGFRDHVAVSSI